MKLTRRDAITLGLGATAASFLPSQADAAREVAVSRFTRGAETQLADIPLQLPHRVTMGATFSAVLATEGVVSAIAFTQQDIGSLYGTVCPNGKRVEFVMTLSTSQDVLVVLKTLDGSFLQASTYVPVFETDGAAL